jgi:hypothetical protein
MLVIAVHEYDDVEERSPRFIDAAELEGFVDVTDYVDPASMMTLGYDVIRADALHVVLEAIKTAADAREAVHPLG